MILVRQHVMFFHEADSTGSMSLDFVEFVAHLPDTIRHQHSEDELRRWFRLADKDEKGSMSIVDFIEWSTQMTELVTTVDILSGLDEAKFTKVAQGMGFGDYSLELFEQLSLSRNGDINSGELCENARLPLAELKIMREFLVAMKWNTTEDAAGSDVDTTGWSFIGTDVEGVRAGLANLLANQGTRLSAIFETLDSDDDNVLVKDEFIEGLAFTLGFQGDHALLKQTFEFIDDDETGIVTFDEMHSWLRCRRRTPRKERLETARALVLEVDHTKMEDWDVERLRLELNKALDGASLKAADLLMAWDVDGSGVLRRREWLVNWKKFVNGMPAAMWYGSVRGAVTDAFDEIDQAREGTLTVGEISRWLRLSREPPLDVISSSTSPTAARPKGKHMGGMHWTLLGSLERESQREDRRAWAEVKEAREFCLDDPNFFRTPATRKPRSHRTST